MVELTELAAFHLPLGAMAALDGSCGAMVMLRTRTVPLNGHTGALISLYCLCVAVLQVIWG